MDNTDAMKCQPLSNTIPDNEYNQHVDKRLEEDSPEVFGNFSYENAKYIIPRFIESASESVTIFAGSIPAFRCNRKGGCKHRRKQSTESRIVNQNHNHRRSSKP